MSRVNKLALLLIIPSTLLFLVPFVLIWDFTMVKTGVFRFLDLILVVLIGGVIIHELLHGITWAFYSKQGFRSIQFGFQWKSLTPYCHCKEPLKVSHYFIGAAMPLIVMGIIPSIIAIISGSGALLCVGIFFTWAAGGDIIALYMLHKLDADEMVSDHPTKMGFYREV